MSSYDLAQERRRVASTTLDRSRRTTLLERAEGYEAHAFEDAQELRAYRERMRQRGLPLRPFLTDSPSSTAVPVH